MPSSTTSSMLRASEKPRRSSRSSNAVRLSGSAVGSASGPKPNQARLKGIRRARTRADHSMEVRTNRRDTVRLPLGAAGGLAPACRFAAAAAHRPRPPFRGTAVAGLSHHEVQLRAAALGRIAAARAGIEPRYTDWIGGETKATAQLRRPCVRLLGSRCRSTATRCPSSPAVSSVTDAGLETDLVFNRGITIRDFAAHTLLSSVQGHAALTRYFVPFLPLARDKTGPSPSR